MHFIYIVIVTCDVPFVFFLTNPHTTEIYTFPTRRSSDLASKITCRRSDVMSKGKKRSGARPGRAPERFLPLDRSEERFSRNAETDLVCRLLLEKKKKKRASSMLSKAKGSATYTTWMRKTSIRQSS